MRLTEIQIIVTFFSSGENGTCHLTQVLFGIEISALDLIFLTSSKVKPRKLSLNLKMKSIFCSP